MNDHRSSVGVYDRQIRRSQGQIVVARGLWYVKPGEAELRTERLLPPSQGYARVAMDYSAISRGTERLVALGQVPRSEWERMRAPFQAGDFPFPVKYGYAAAGRVISGVPALVGQRVFALHPHQDVFQIAEADLTPIPESIPSRRATLAANMETALNAHWDAGTAPGDRVLIVGAGIVGLLIAHLARRIAGTDVTLTDIDAGRQTIAEALGLRFVEPEAATRDNRLVFHTSASASGLQTAIDACGFEGTVIELSWYGSRAVTLNLGAAFHSRRLKITSSQVGHVAPTQRPHLTRKDRLTRALAMLDDPVLDVLVTDEIPFGDLPDALPGIWSSSCLPPVVAYSALD